MHNVAKRAWFLLALGLLAVPVVAIGLAHACTGLATVSANPGAATVGERVTISGKGFAPHDPADVRGGPAEIRIDDQRGPVLATASPAGGAAGGSFNAQITVPELPPGDHIVIVTQTAASGQPAYGTPARQVLTVSPSAGPGQPPGQPLGQPPAAPASQPVAGQPAAGQTGAGTTAAGQPPGATDKPARSQADLKKAVAKCKKNYSTKKARTPAGKRRIAKKRAACIAKAKSRF